MQNLPLDQVYANHFKKIKLETDEQSLIVNLVNDLMRRLNYYTYVAGYHKVKDGKKHINKLICALHVIRKWPVPKDLKDCDDFNPKLAKLRMQEADEIPNLKDGCPAWIDALCKKELGDAWDNEKPAHNVTLSDYMIAKTEVTQGLWIAVMGTNPSYFKGYDLPVESVSWDDCQEFIKKLNQLTGKTYRLPTEAEWEYAARGGKKSKGYQYAGGNSIKEVAWYNGNTGYGTHPVGQKQPNELGLYDMSGNVWEWCQDWYDSYASSSQTNPTGPTSGSYRVLRGGSWDYGVGECRVSNREASNPSFRSGGRGFRLVLVP
jgi:hypothetical protein